MQTQSFFWSVISGIWSEYGKIQTRKCSVFVNFLRTIFQTKADKGVNFPDTNFKNAMFSGFDQKVNQIIYI